MSRRWEKLYGDLIDSLVDKVINEFRTLYDPPEFKRSISAKLPADLTSAELMLFDVWLKETIEEREPSYNVQVTRKGDSPNVMLDITLTRQQP